VADTFDPDKFLAETTPPPKQRQAGDVRPEAFDPDKFLAETAPANPKASPEGVDVKGIANSAMRGVAQGSTLGFADEATAGIGGLLDYVQAKLGQRGDIGLSDAYHTRRDAIRRADAQAQAEHPGVYAGGELAGGLATAFAPGLGALNVGKGAGLVEAVGKGAALGGLAGAGGAKEITDVPGEALRGAAVGGAVGGGLHVAGKVAGAVADKLRPEKAASILLNAPEGAVKRYIEDRAAVNAARPRDQLVEDFLGRMEGLNSDVSGGSQASRDILAQEGKKVTGSQISDILNAKADEILHRSEGVIDDPQIAAAYRWLRDTAEKYKPQIPGEVTSDLQKTLLDIGIDSDTVAKMPAEAERHLSTNRVKDLLQTLDKRTEYGSAPGQFSAIDDRIRQDVRGQIDRLLKDESPAYTEQMKKVAADSRLLNEVADLAKSPQGFDNLLKRTQRGNTPHLMQSLEAFDKRTGGGLIRELQDSAVKDALNRGAINGSRNELLYGGMADAIGEAIGGLPGKIAGRTVGLLGGATVDKYGPAMARRIVDSSAQMQELLRSSQGIQSLGKYAQPLIEAAMRGNQQLAATHAYLMASDPNYGKALEARTDIRHDRGGAMQRRALGE
jgi:hypothetical protein